VENNHGEDVISVLLPIHGEAPYLGRVLQSVFNQETVSVELIVILDRPTQSLISQIEGLTTDYENVNLFVSPGSGISDALNFGLGKCTGKYIARIDSDDEMVKNRLVKQKQFLDYNLKTNCVGTQIIKISENNSKVGRSHYPGSNLLLRRVLRIRNCLAHPSVMFRRDDVIKIGGYRSMFDGAEDYDLWIRLSRVGKIENLKEQLTRYRIWSGQDTKKYKNAKVIIAHKVRVIAELEDIAAEDMLEIQSYLSDPNKYLVEAEKYIRLNSSLRWLRLERVLEINALISSGSGKFKVKSLLIISKNLLILVSISAAIKFARNK
jgi:glycosyltransferase involved in cell wall biosynthesis